MIPGSFRALLKADGATIAQRGFFQSTEPRACHTCRMIGVIDLDFLVEADKVRDAELTAEIELLSRDDPAWANGFPCMPAAIPP